MFLITAGFYWKIVLARQHTALDGPDMVIQVIPWLQFQAREWQQGRLPLWDPHLLGGQPLAAQVMPGTLNPFNWPLFFVPLRNGFLPMSALHWYYALIHWLAALFAYALCRDLGLSRAAAVFGGCAFGFGGFMGTIGWPQILCSALWMPLVLMAFLRVLRGERPQVSGALGGLLLGLSFLGTHHNVPVFFTVVMAGLWAWQLAVPAGRRTELASAGAAFFVCLALVASAQALPARELGRESLRWVNAPYPVTWEQKVPYTVHSEFSTSPAELPGLIFPGLARHTDPFIGVVAVTFALLGLAARWRERAVRVLAVVALAGLLLALGGWNLFHGLLYALAPYFEKARNPSTAAAILHAGVAGLAAFGLDACRALEDTVYRGKRVASAALLGLGLLLYAGLFGVGLANPEAGVRNAALGLTALAALLLAAVLFGWAHGALTARSAAVLSILILLIEVNHVATASYRHRDQPWLILQKLFENQDVAAFLKSRPERIRVDVEDEAIPYNFGDWFGIDQHGGHVPSVLRRTMDLLHEPVGRRLLAVNYRVARKPPREGQQPVFSGAWGVNVYPIEDALPRARSVHQAAGFADDSAVVAALRAGQIDVARTAALAGTPPALESCAGEDSVRLHSYEPDRVVMDVEMQCRGMVVLGDAWFPGWNARVDGNAAPVHRAYNLVRSVVVEKGQHTVELRYQPPSVRLGAALALLGVVGWAVLRWRAGRLRAVKAPAGTS